MNLLQNMLARSLQRWVVALCLAGIGFGCNSKSQGDAEQHGSSPALPYVEIVDSRALTLIDAASPVTVIADGFLWTEGPVWIESEGVLLFSDIPSNTVFRFDPSSGISKYLEKAGATGLIEGDYDAGPNGLLLDSSDRLVVFQQGDRRVSYMDAPLHNPRGKFEALVSHFEGNRFNSPNDGVFHSNGSLYFTDPPYGLPEKTEDARKELSFQGIYLLGSNGTLSLLDDTVSFPNGIGLSLDEKVLYVAVSDPERPIWLAYDVLPDGTVTNRRVFYDAGNLIGASNELGLPDGMDVHSTDIVFATGPGGVWLFSPDGEVLGKIRTGKRTANCVLSADESVLYITAHDTLMSVALKTQQE